MPIELVQLVVLAQAIPAHRMSAQIGGAVVFALLLLGVIALFKHVSRRASIERADAVIEEHWAALEAAEEPPATRDRTCR